MDTQTVGSHCTEKLPDLQCVPGKLNLKTMGQADWKGEKLQTVVFSTGRPLDQLGSLHQGPTPRDSYLIGLEWGPDFSIFKSSPGNSNEQLGLRTFTVDDTVNIVIAQAKMMI